MKVDPKAKRSTISPYSKVSSKTSNDKEKSSKRLIDRVEKAIHQSMLHNSKWVFNRGVIKSSIYKIGWVWERLGRLSGRLQFIPLFFCMRRLDWLLEVPFQRIAFRHFVGQSLLILLLLLQLSHEVLPSVHKSQTVSFLLGFCQPLLLLFIVRCQGLEWLIVPFGNLINLVMPGCSYFKMEGLILMSKSVLVD